MFPKELKDLNQWVINSPNSKVPLQTIKDNSNNFLPASTSKPETWSSYEVAKETVTNNDGYYLGFVFDNNGIVGIDIDTGFDGLGLFPTQESMDIIEHCKSYCEKSKSGRGFHILVRGKLPFKGKNNMNGIEIYQDGRYFVMTGNTMLYTKIVDNQEAIDYIVNRYFTNVLKENKMGNKVYTPIWDEVNDWHNIKLEPTYPPMDEGNRNLCLTSLGGQLWTQGLPKDYVYRTLLMVNSKACSKPISVGEVQLILKSVTKYRRV